ncbi:MAG TPA: YcxB family protein [Pyrinomonadaceae bacterium]|jgi:hypothetical protein
MRIQFEVTPEEMVDATLRVLDRSPTYCAQRTRNVLLLAFIMAVISFFAVSFGLPGASLWAKLLVSGFAAVIGGVVQLFTERWNVERRLHAYSEERLGTDKAINFRVELTPDGILTEGQGTQVNFVWPNVEEIAETDDSIDFFMRNGSLVVVRKRAFASAEEMRRFLALAAEYRARPRNFAEAVPHD